MTLVKLVNQDFHQRHCNREKRLIIKTELGRYSTKLDSKPNTITLCAIKNVKKA